MLWDLFSTFLMIGFVSFGGGYAMLPVIETEVTRQGWMSIQEFTDIIAVAGMSPGPIATNSAIFVGYQTMGFPGAVVSALGMVLPSLVIILLVATFFYRIHDHHLVQSAFYGLRPIITGLIIYAALHFALSNEVIAALSWHTISLLGIFAVALFALIHWRIHPFYVILASGVLGVIVYG